MTTGRRVRGAIGCCVAAVLAAGAVVGLAGCAAAPAPEATRERAAAAFDELVDGLSDIDTGTLRTVEVLPEARRPCADGEGEQASLTARASLSVTAPDDAISGIMDDLAPTLDAPAWSVIDTGGDAEAERAWASDDGVVVTLVDATPILLLAVFPPCGV